MARGNGDRRIVPFSIRVERDLRYSHPASDKELFVGNFDGGGSDLLTTISAFVEALPADVHIARDDRHFGMPTSIRRKGRSISWCMDGGESGRASSIVLKRGEEAQQRDRTGVEWVPFWVMAVVPKDANHGWLFVEKDGRHTLPTEWRKELIQQFAKTHKGYRLAISTIREESLWAQVENALDEPRVVGFEVALRAPDGKSPHGYTRGMAQVDRQVFRSTNGPVLGRVLRQFRRNYSGIRGPEGVMETNLPVDYDDLTDGNVKVQLMDGVVELKATLLNDAGVERTVAFEGLDGQQTFVMTGTSDAQPSQEKFETECAAVVSDLATSGGLSMLPGWDKPEWTHPLNAPTMKVIPDDEQRQAS